MKYKTVDKLSVATIEVKHSRFIGHLMPYNQFEVTLERLRAEHRKANHHVTAFRYMDENDRVIELGKDDGEPSGTSGMPVLKTLIGANLMDVAVIVTRYFGGTKLGTGGLARAYSGAANEVIQISKLILWQQFMDFEACSTFEQTSMIEALIAKTSVSVVDRKFETNGVRFLLSGTKEDAAQFKGFKQ